MLKIKLSNYLDNFVGKRFKDIFDIVNTILSYKNFCNAHLVRDEGDRDYISDDFLIGSVETIKGQIFDIQIYYIKDNYGNYYITETTVLDEVI